MRLESFLADRSFILMADCEVGELVRYDNRGHRRVATVFADPDADYPCQAEITVRREQVAVGVGDSPDEAADSAIDEFNFLKEENRGKGRFIRFPKKPRL